MCVCVLVCVLGAESGLNGVMPCDATDVTFIVAGPSIAGRERAAIECICDSKAPQSVSAVLIGYRQFGFADMDFLNS